MSTSRPTVTVVVPALDEERHVAHAIEEVERAVGDRFADWEILAFDDGSRDATGAVLDGLANTRPRVRVVHNPAPRNLGGVYKQAIRLARFEFLVLVPGDGEIPAEALVPVFDAVGRADLVVPVPTNASARGAGRFVLSRAYTAVLNALFGLRVPYYNGTVVQRTEAVRAIRIETDSFAFQAEAIVKLVRAGRTFVTVPIATEVRAGRRTKAFRAKNVLGVVASVARLFADVRLGIRL